MTRAEAGLAILLLLAPAPALAEPHELPAPEEVFVISVKPQARQLASPFTPETLKAALPRFKRAWVQPPIGGKIWQQSGVIVLKDGRVLYWRSYRDDVLVIETAAEPVTYVLQD